MAVNKKDSRKIVVGEHEFRWRATGNDDFITVVIWPTENDRCRVIGTTKYHQSWMKHETEEGSYTADSQIVVTNRVIREVILHVGVEAMLAGNTPMKIGAIENFYDFSNAIRSQDPK